MKTIKRKSNFLILKSQKLAFSLSLPLVFFNVLYEDLEESSTYIIQFDKHKMVFYKL